jgi:predicted nuclease of predicted toxin-antitoxin system
MRFLVDESTGKRLHILLEESGHDSIFVGDVMSGFNDAAVLAKAEEEKRILITDDKDFGELIFRLGRPSSGVILLRDPDTRPRKRLEILVKVMKRHRLEGSFVTLRNDRIRIRKLPAR